jgi:hypothetical protein
MSYSWKCTHFKWFLAKNQNESRKILGNTSKTVKNASMNFLIEKIQLIWTNRDIVIRATPDIWPAG